MGARFAKVEETTINAVLPGDGLLPARAYAALVFLALHSFPLNKQRKDAREAVRAWLAENAPDVAPDGLQVVSMSVSQLQEKISPNSRSTAQGAIRDLLGSGALIEVRKGVKGRPGLYLIGPLAVSGEACEPEYDPYDDPPP